MSLNNEKIAIFIFYYPVAYSPSILNTALFWAKIGYEVQIITDRFVFSEIEDLHPSIKVVYCTNLGQLPSIPDDQIEFIDNSKLANPQKKLNKNNPIVRSIWKHLPEKARVLLWDIRQFKRWSIPFLKYILGIYKYVFNNHYKFIIAFEPEGLIMAAMISKNRKIPFYYHSLELYDGDNITNRIRKYLEKKANRKASFTLVQDAYRAKELISTNNIAIQNIRLMPVSIYGPTIIEKSRMLNERFHIGYYQKIILYIGGITDDMCCLEIAEQTTGKEWKENWVLVFHGFISDKKYLKNILEKTDRKRVFISLQTVDQKSLDILTSSADIGIGLYNGYNSNNKYSIYSSGKIAQYAKCGLPVILNNIKPNEDHINKYKNGICIKNISGLTQAIDKILSNYDEYRTNSFRVFDEKYNFENNYSQIKDLCNIL